MNKFELKFEGNDTENHEIDFYDTAQAMVGFQRSLALTTHLVLNGTIITQAPALQGARVLLRPQEAGSYKIPAYITSIGLAAYGIGTADTDTVLGHLVYSAYDYTVQKTLGFNVDFDKSLGQQYEELQKNKQNEIPIVSEEKFDSLIEKIEPAMKEVHRPIVKSHSALAGVIISQSKEAPFEVPLNADTYAYLIASDQDNDLLTLNAKVSSYNINTFRGRAYFADAKRPIPFALDDVAQSASAVARITASLRANARNKMNDEADIELTGYANRSPTGRFKSFLVVDVD